MLRYLTVITITIFSFQLNAQPYNTSHQTDSKTAVLYYHPNCPHCKTVISFLNQQNKTLPMKNTSNPTNKSELNQLGQRGVPALVVGSRVIAGSHSIINYLEQHPEVMH